MDAVIYGDKKSVIKTENTRSATMIAVTVKMMPTLFAANPLPDNISGNVIKRTMITKILNWLQL